MSDQDDLTAGTDGSAGDVPTHSPAAPPIQPPPVAEPGRREVKVDEHGNIAELVECRACGYNLQGLSPAPESLCPECSMPIARSIHGDELRFSEPGWVRCLAQGVLFILIGVFTVIGASVLFGVSVAAYAIVTQGAFNPNLIVTAAGLLALPSLLIIFGAWRLTTPDPGQTESEPPLSARRLARWCIMASVIAIPLQMLSQQGAMVTGPNAAAVPAPNMAVQAVGIVAQIPTAIGHVAGLLYLSRLARRIPHASLERQSRIVMWGYAVASGLGLVVGFISLTLLSSMLAGVQAAGGGGNPQPASWASMIFMGVAGGLAGCASLVFNVWALVLLFRFRAQFVAQAEVAEANWAAA